MLYTVCRLADLDAGGRDTTEYYKWKEEMAQRDAAEEKARVERKHLVSSMWYLWTCVCVCTHHCVCGWVDHFIAR